MLFVPGDSEKKLAKAADTGADALILDLEDAVSAERIGTARGMVLDFLRAHADRSTQQLWVRINPLSTELSLPDLAAIMPGAPDGILLPKTSSAQDLRTLDNFITALECREELRRGSTRIMTVSTEVPAALFSLGGYAGVSQRLAGLTWGAEDLSTALGASTNRGEDQQYEFTYRMARSMCLLAAANAGVQAIDTLTANFRDTAALEREVRGARREGFTGKLAIHPAQVQAINQGFSPDAEELRQAQRIVDAFAAAQGAGALQLDGKMLDKPHLTQAQRILASVR